MQICVLDQLAVSKVDQQPTSTSMVALAGKTAQIDPPIKQSTILISLFYDKEISQMLT